MNKTICVYCSSSNHIPQSYIETARELGAEMARRGHSLVYGGGRVGLMGVLAEALLAAKGNVVGVIPVALRTPELAHEGVTELIVTRDMHERKATMARRSDAFVALPGGFGTFEEITEIVAHRQLRIHRKPCVILNLNGYFDSLLAQFERAFKEGFVGEEHRENYYAAATVAETLDFIEHFPVS